MSWSRLAPSKFYANESEDPWARSASLADPPVRVATETPEPAPTGAALNAGYGSGDTPFPNPGVTTPDGTHRRDSDPQLAEVKCPRCDWNVLLPVEPLYDMAFAAAIIPMSLTRLKNYLSDHRDEFPARYRIAWRKPRKYKIRVLLGSEIQLIRARFMEQALDGVKPKRVKRQAHPKPPVEIEIVDA